jgi:ribosomal protein L7/L12
VSTSSSSTNPGLPPAAQSAIREGNLIEAIKVVRQERSLGLKEAKDVVDAYIQSHEQPTSTGAPLASDIPLKSMLALRQGNKIEAIRVVHTNQGLGLKESKEAVEAYIARHPELQTVLGAEQSKMRRKLIFVAILMVASALAYFWLRRS